MFPLLLFSLSSHLSLSWCLFVCTRYRGLVLYRETGLSPSARRGSKIWLFLQRPHIQEHLFLRSSNASQENNSKKCLHFPLKMLSVVCGRYRNSRQHICHHPVSSKQGRDGCAFGRPMNYNSYCPSWSVVKKKNRGRVEPVVVGHFKKKIRV